MAPKCSSKRQGKARAKMPTSVINQRLLLDRDRIKGFISEHIHGLIRIYTVCSIKDERTWELFYDKIFLDADTTRPLKQFQLRWPHRRRRSLPFRVWWAALRSSMGQLFDNTRHKMNNWRCDNPRPFGDKVNHSNPQTTSSGKVKHTGEHFSWYGSDDLRVKIELPSCRLYKPGDFLAFRLLNWDEIIDEDVVDDSSADPCVQSGGRSRPGDGNDNDNGESEEDSRGGENGTGKVKGTQDGKRKGKATEDEKVKGMGQGKGNGKGKGIVKYTTRGDDISRAVALQLQKEMSQADFDTKG
jgi:hypothetical protein